MYLLKTLGLSHRWALAVVLVLARRILIVLSATIVRTMVAELRATDIDAHVSAGLFEVLTSRLRSLALRSSR